MLSSNQKEVLYKQVLGYISEYKVISLLDIGAGDGALAQKLSRAVKQYTAIEQNKEFIKKLKKVGVKPVECTFPCKIGGRYDMVLSSHSIPEEKTRYKPFLEKAWGLVRASGILLIVTFKGAKQGSGKEIHDKELYKEMTAVLRTLGQIKVKRANGFVGKRTFTHLFLSVEKNKKAPW